MPNQISINEMALAIKNQFELQSDESIQQANEKEQYERLKMLLSEKLRELIDFEFEKFVNILYRIDVNEEKVKSILAESPIKEATDRIAELIIERQHQKLITRKKYSKPGDGLSFDI